MQRIASYLAQDLELDEIADLIDYPLDALESIATTPMMNRLVAELKLSGLIGVDTFMETSQNLTMDWSSDDEEGDPT
jgi:hypothetical protein